MEVHQAKLVDIMVAKPAPPPPPPQEYKSKDLTVNPPKVLHADTQATGTGGLVSEIPIHQAPQSTVQNKPAKKEDDDIWGALLKGILEGVEDAIHGDGSESGDDSTPGVVIAKPVEIPNPIKSGGDDEDDDPVPAKADDTKVAQGKPKADDPKPKPKDEEEDKPVKAGGEPPKADPKKDDDGPVLGKRETFKSVADPHVTTADGLKYDNGNTGDFVLAKSKSGDFMVQAHQDAIAGNSGVWQTEGAVKTDGDVVKYDAASNTVDINGKKVPFEAGKTIELPGGGTVKMTHDKLDNGTPFDRLQVHTKEGDDVYMLNFKRNGSHYLDIVGTASAQRHSGEIMGSAGTIDGDGNKDNDMRTRDGKVTKNVDSFLDDWRVNKGESIL